MELEERVRNLEITLSFLKGAFVVGIAAVVIFMGVTSFMQIPNQITKQIDDKIGEDTRTKIEAALSKADTFLKNEAHNIWPEGHYCILKSGSCPSGFTASRGALNALWMVRSDGGYLVESNFGESWIKHHGSKDQKPDSPDWHGELVIATCCK